MNFEFIDEYINIHKDRFLNELFELIKIKTISNQNQYKEEMIRAAQYIKKLLNLSDINDVQFFNDYGAPIIFAQKIKDPSLKTILFYAHYDVQPVDPLNLWNHDPFDPIIENGRIVARGASDDKGMLIMIIKALEILNNVNSLPCNVKIIFEGGEEKGSPELNKFLDDENNVNILDCNHIVVCDTGMVSYETPSIATGLRGIIHFDLTLTGPCRDLHSGSYGGAVVNPIHALCKVINSLHDENNRITVEGFYDDVPQLTPLELEGIKKLPFDHKTYMNDLQVDSLVHDDFHKDLIAVRYEPTIEVNGIYGGYIEEGSKTIIPSSATAKFSFRLVGYQKPDDVFNKFIKHIEKVLPKGVKYQITNKDAGSIALHLSTESKMYKAASEAIKIIWGKEPITDKAGGSIPIVSKMKEKLNTEVVLLGFTSPYDKEHSPNESFCVDAFMKGITTLIYYLDKYIS